MAKKPKKQGKLKENLEYRFSIDKISKFIQRKKDKNNRKTKKEKHTMAEGGGDILLHSTSRPCSSMNRSNKRLNPFKFCVNS